MSRWDRCLVAVLFCLASPALAQQAASPKPGPEHAHLQSLEGTWDAAMKMPGAPEAMPGVMVCRLECEGLWLTSDFRSTTPGFVFHGKGFDGYDQVNKKYVAVWVDSMITSPMHLTGTYDAATRTSTMIGEGPGEDGKPVRFKNVTKMKDDDHQTFQMFRLGANGEETLTFTIDYTRRK